MSNKLNTLEALREASLRAKGYTASQIAELADTLQEILDEMQEALAACVEHAESAHAPSTAEENVVASIKKNGNVIAPVGKSVDIAIPTKVSDIENDRNFATTSYVNESVSGSGHLRSEIVEQLPSLADAKANTIYFVRRGADSITGNQFKQYQLINGAFQRIGPEDTDLTGYVTESYVEKASAALITSIFNNVVSTDEKYIGTANLALFWSLIKPLIATGGTALDDIIARVELLELVLLNGEIEGNPFYVIFNDLDGVTAQGVWNKDMNRIEF